MIVSHHSTQRLSVGTVGSLFLASSLAFSPLDDASPSVPFIYYHYSRVRCEPSPLLVLTFFIRRRLERDVLLRACRNWMPPFF